MTKIILYLLFNAIEDQKKKHNLLKISYITNEYQLKINELSFLYLDLNKRKYHNFKIMVIFKLNCIIIYLYQRQCIVTIIFIYLNRFKPKICGYTSHIIVTQNSKVETYKKVPDIFSFFIGFWFFEIYYYINLKKKLLTLCDLSIVKCFLCWYIFWILYNMSVINDDHFHFQSKKYCLLNI